MVRAVRVVSESSRRWSAHRPTVGAGALGIARAAHEYALEYALQRRTFGKPIAAHQAIAFKLADMATEIEAARLLVWKAAWAVDQNMPIAKNASMAKLKAGELRCAGIWGDQHTRGLRCSRSS